MSTRLYSKSRCPLPRQHFLFPLARVPDGRSNVAGEPTADLQLLLWESALAHILLGRVRDSEGGLSVCAR